MKKVYFEIGPIEVQAPTITKARELAIADAATILDRLASCPQPIAGPPESGILAIVFSPLSCNIAAWTATYVLQDRSFYHQSAREIGEVRKMACEFAAEYGSNATTSQGQVEDRVDWLQRHLGLTYEERKKAQARLELQVRMARAHYDLKHRGISPTEAHSVLLGDPSLEGPLLELSKSIREKYAIH